MKLVIPPDLTAQIRRAAEAAYPEECCGLLIGRGGEGLPVEVTAIAPASNVAADPRRQFEIDPAVLIHWQRTLRGGELRIVGHYHSHPDGRAIPSQKDRDSVFDRDMVWLIVPVTSGRAGDDLSAWAPDRQAGDLRRVALSP